MDQGADTPEWGAPSIVIEVIRKFGDGGAISRQVITLMDWASAPDQGALAAETINAGLAEIDQVMLDSELPR